MRFVSCALALSFALSLLVSAAPLQDLTPKLQAVVKEYDALHELQDLRGINRLVVRDPKSIDEILTQFAVKFAIDGDSMVFERLGPMIAAFDEVEQGKRVTMRFDRLKVMDVAAAGRGSPRGTRGSRRRTSSPTPTRSGSRPTSGWRSR